MALDKLMKVEPKPFDISDRSNDEYSGKKRAKLGTPKNPALLVVKSEERREEIRALFKKNGWIERTKVRPNEEENLRDLELLQNEVATFKKEHHTGRNEPCICGSGKKYKKCCLKNS